MEKNKPLTFSELLRRRETAVRDESEITPGFYEVVSQLLEEPYDYEEEGRDYLTLFDTEMGKFRSLAWIYSRSLIYVVDKKDANLKVIYKDLIGWVEFSPRLWFWTRVESPDESP